MKVAEIGAEMGKRVGRSVGESVSSRSTPGNHRLGSPRATVYRKRGLQRQIISAELSRLSPPPTQIASLPVWTNPSVQKTKGGDGGSGGGGAAIFTLPLWLYAAGSAWWLSGSLTSQSLRGLKSTVRLNCDWKGKSESQILISHDLDVGVFIQLVIISVISVQEGRRC